MDWMRSFSSDNELQIRLTHKYSRVSSQHIRAKTKYCGDIADLVTCLRLTSHAHPDSRSLNDYARDGAVIYQILLSLPVLPLDCKDSMTTMTQYQYSSLENSQNVDSLRDEAPPPPLQIAATPILPFVSRNTPNRVVTILAPLPPSG